MKFVSTLAIVAAGFVAQAEAFGCKPDEITGWIHSCDLVMGSGREAMCHDRECHKALHRLVEEETRDCYVSSGMGPDPSPLDWYIKVDNFCHGDGQDPGEKPVPTTPPTQAPTTAPTNAPPSDAPPSDAPPSDGPTTAPTAPPANVTDMPVPTHVSC